MRIQSLGWEDPLEEEMATYTSILACEIPWARGVAKSHTNNWAHTHILWSYLGKKFSCRGAPFKVGIPKNSHFHTWLLEKNHVSRIIKKAECRRIAFELWCRRRLLKVPWTARRSNQSILKEINPECSLEGLMLKLKLQYFCHLMRKDPDAGKDWRQEKKGTTEDKMIRWHHRLNGHEFE